ncbi:SHOCT domain-containing protein [Hymenobacter sp. IS2118]|uniref:SHOCT domain-containing protein n=1 Tax=Hymenobacter sp. IS2118 TaxID=1505605 RepID=UPI00054D2417|nr:SHOCT domain-containing protein [Hymenobacter sp. IS2118]
MENPASPLDTLRQLKEMLDAGALTPTEFEALKKRLLFSEAVAPPTSPAPFAPAAPLAAELPVVVPTTPVSSDDEPSAPSSQQVITEPDAANHYSATSRAEQESRNASAAAGLPAGGPPPLVGPPPVPAADSEAWADDEFSGAARPPARSPLALVLSIGGLLALLGLVVYLSFNRPPSERLTSTSRTAADSVATNIEVGPQAEPLPPVAEAEPEIIRVVPANPAPPVSSQPALPPPDSVDMLPAPDELPETP